MFKKLTALIISLAMVIGAIQFNAVSVFAEAQITTNGGLSVFTQDSGGIEYDSAAGLVTISGAGEFLVWGSTEQETIKVTDSTDSIKILLSSVSIESSTAAPIEIDCGNEVAIRFEGSCSLISNSDDQDYPGVNYAGIQKTSVDNTLVIGGQWGETETLTVQGGYKSAGIGGGQGAPGKNITIDNNGTVTAYGGMLAAGIGGGCDYYGTTKSTVTINGGTVYAYGGGAAAGIGSGRGDSVGNNVTTINGGTVYAYGGSDKDDYYGGAGIGGAQGDGGDVTITGGTVYAYGAEGAAGIGAGCTGTIQNRTISISGGTVFAQGGAYYNDENDYYIGGAGIGSGYGYGSGTIKITGGSIVAEETLTELADNNGDTIPDGYISDIGYGYYGYNSPSTINISATESNGAIFLGDGDYDNNEAYGVTPSSGTVYKNKGSDRSTYPVYVYTQELEFDPEFDLKAVVDGNVTDFNANDEITVNLVVSSDSDDANVGSFQFALEGDWFTLQNVNSPAGSLALVNTYYASASITRLNTDVDSDGEIIATAVLKVNSDIKTTENAAISFNTSSTNIVSPTGTGQEITPTMTGTTVNIYNLKVTFKPGNSAFGSSDVTAAYARYNETGLYKDNTYTEAVSVPTPTANEGYKLADPLWSDGTNTYADNAAVEGIVFTADTALTVQTVKQYTVTISPADSTKGTLYQDGTAVTAETTVTVDENSSLADLNLTFTMADNTSYIFTGVTVDNTTDVAYANFDSYAVQDNIAIAPVIEPNSFTITLTSEEEPFALGSTTGIESSGVKYGTDVTLEIGAQTGAAIYSVYYTVGDDTTTYSLTPSNGVYTISGTDILGNINVYITAKKYFEVTFTSGEGNTMTNVTGYAWNGLPGVYSTVPELGKTAVLYTVNDINETLQETGGYRLTGDTTAEPRWSDGTDALTTEYILGTQKFTADTAYTALSVKQYTVTFASGGNGTVGEASRTVDTGSTLGTLPTVTPDSYYTFASWQIGSAEYTDSELLALNITDDITVTAVFEPAKYPVTFTSSNYGTFSAESGVDNDRNGTYLTDIVFTFDTSETVEYVFYSINGNTKTVSASNGVYTIPGSEVTGAVSVYYDTDDMAVYTFYVDSEDSAKGSLTGSTAFILSNGASLTDSQISSIGISEETGYSFDHWEVTAEGTIIGALTSVSLAALSDEALSGSAIETAEFVEADLAAETYIGKTYTNDGLLSLTADRNLTFKAVFKLTDFNVTDENGKASVISGLENGYAHMGTDLVFCFDSCVVYYAAYKIDDGSEVVLTGTADTEGSFTIPGSEITGDITIVTKTLDTSFEFISHNDYLGEEITAGKGKQIAVITADELDSGNLALISGSEFFYSESYGAYVMLVDESETAVTMNGKMTSTQTETIYVDYSGDINGTGVVTAADAGIINDILENNWTSDVTDAQLLALDVNYTESPKQVYTSDIVWILDESIGLSHS